MQVDFSSSSSSGCRIFVGARTYIEFREEEKENNTLRLYKPAKEEGTERFVDVPLKLFLFIEREMKAVMINALTTEAPLRFEKEWLVSTKTGDNGQFIIIENRDPEKDIRRGYKCFNMRVQNFERALDEVKKRVETASDTEEEGNATVEEQEEEEEDVESGVDMMFDLARPLPSSQRKVALCEKRKMPQPSSSTPPPSLRHTSSLRVASLPEEPSKIKAPRLSEAERFKWVKKQVKDESVVEKSKKWFMRMSNCISHGRRFAQIMLEEGAHFLDFDAETIRSYPTDVIEKVFLYFLKSEYSAKVSDECTGCDSSLPPTNYDYGQHDLCCLKHEDCLVDSLLVKKVMLKIPAVRIHAGALAICNLFKVDEFDLPLSDVEKFLSNKVCQETFDKMCRAIDFEKEVEDELKNW